MTDIVYIRIDSNAIVSHSEAIHFQANGLSSPSLKLDLQDVPMCQWVQELFSVGHLGKSKGLHE